MQELNFESKLFFRNMSSIPKFSTDPNSSFAQFAMEEKRKCLEGLNVNGLFIPGTLYYFLNHVKIDIETLSGIQIKSPDLRDTDWEIHTNHYEAKTDRLGTVVGGSRQIGKSATLVSLATYHLNLINNSEVLSIFSTKADKETFAKKLDIQTKHNTPWLTIPNIDKDLTKTEIRFGVTKKNNQTEVRSKLFMYLSDEGRNVQVGSGKTPSLVLFDEIAKHDMLQVHEAILPAVKSQLREADGKLRAEMFYAFCVCKGTKIYTGDGLLKNIEDLKQEDGILGFDGKKVVKQDINFLKPPMKKLCYKVTFNDGSFLECSHDHPLLKTTRDECFNKNGETYRNLTYTNVEHLKKKDQILKPIEVKHFGDLSIPNARLIGSKLNKRLPTNIHEYDEESLCELLGGYFDADGNVRKNRIVLTSIVYELLEQVKYQLLKLGIHSSIYKENRNTLPTEEYKGQQDHIYRLYISKGKDIIQFRDKIKLLSVEKTKRLENIKLSRKSIKILKGFFSINPLNNKKGYFNLDTLDDSVLENLTYNTVTSIENIGYQDVYTLNCSRNHNYLSNGFITRQTGGEVEKGVDARKLYFSPRTYSFKEFKEGTGIFIPGEYHNSFKKDSTLKELVNYETGVKEIDDFPVRVTDWEYATEKLDEEEALAKVKDLQAYYMRKMFFPRSRQDIFLSGKGNMFSHLIDEFERLLAFLEKSPNASKPKRLDIFNDKEGRTKLISNKPILTDFPVGTKQLFELDTAYCQMVEPNLDVSGRLYSIGVDMINVNKTEESASLASIYVMQGETTDYSDPWNNRIIGWYNGRTDLKKLRDLLLSLCVLHGGLDGKCTILHEAPDDNLTQWFDSQNLGFLLEDSYSLAREINRNTKSQNMKGMRPALNNQKFYLQLILDYCEEVMEDGTLGLWRIPDPYVVKQLMNFDGNLSDKDACFVAGTRIITKNGFKNIEDVKIGDEVLTHKGRFKKVIETFKSNYTKDLYKIKRTGSHESLITTENHPHYSNHLINRRYQVKYDMNKAECLSEKTWIKAKDLTKNNYLITVKNKELSESILTPQEQYILGWYLSDGYLSPSGRLKITFQGDQLDIAERMKMLLEEYDPFKLTYFESTHWLTGRKFTSHTKKLKPTISKIKNKHAYNLECTSEWVKQIIEKSTIIKPGGEKVLKSEIIHSKNLDMLILGFFEGDGSLVNNPINNTNRWTLSVSGAYLELIQQFNYILTNHNYNVNMSHTNTQNKRNKTGMNYKDQITLKILNPEEINRLIEHSLKFKQIDLNTIKYKSHTGIDDEYFYNKIKDIEIIPNSGIEVYNIEVEDDHSYTANNTVTHNCVAWGHCLMNHHKLKGLRKIKKLNEIEEEEPTPRVKSIFGSTKSHYRKSII